MTVKNQKPVTKVLFVSDSLRVDPATKEISFRCTHCGKRLPWWAFGLRMMGEGKWTSIGEGAPYLQNQPRCGPCRGKKGAHEDNQISLLGDSP